MEFKKDFGLFLKEEYNATDQNIVLPIAFVPLKLVLYPNGISSITVETDGMIGTFDFDDDILKKIIYILSQNNGVDTEYIKKRIWQQNNDPIVIDLLGNKVINIVLTCKLGDTEKSTMTGEEFVVLIIKDLEIIN